MKTTPATPGVFWWISFFMAPLTSESVSLEVALYKIYNCNSNYIYEMHFDFVALTVLTILNIFYNRQQRRLRSKRKGIMISL